MELRNNNRAIIRSLADETYRRNKGRNRILICAAAFAVILVFCVFSFAAGKLEAEELASVRGSGTASGYSLQDPEKGQYEKIKELPYVRYAGRVWTFGMAERDGAPVFFCTCISEKTFQQVYRPAVTGLTGSFPKEADQIMLSRDALANLDIQNPKPGMKLQLTIVPRDRERPGAETGDEERKARKARRETFTLSGYFTEYRSVHVLNEMPGALFSAEYLKERPPAGDISCQLMILPKEVLYDWDEQKRQGEQLQRDAGIRSSQLLDGYFIQSDRKERIQTCLEAACISFFALLLAGLLVHNVTGISMHNSIRHYGMLKTLGATERQIRRILRRQVLKTALPGAVLGGAAGLILVKLLLPILLETLYLRSYGPAERVMGFHPGLLGLSVLLVMIITVVSAMSPARKVSRLSPMETQSWRSRWSGNRKKSLLVVLTMSMGILAAMVSSMLTAGFDREQVIEQEPDFRISAWVRQTADEGFSILDRGTEERIRRVRGIESVRTARVSYLFLDGRETIWKPLNPDSRLFGSALLIDEDLLKQLEQYGENRGCHPDFEGVRAGRSAIVLHAKELSSRQEREAESLIGTEFRISDAAETKNGSLGFGGYLSRAGRGFPQMRLPMHSAREPILLMTREGFRRAGLEPQIQDMELTVRQESEPSVKEQLQEILKQRERSLWKEAGNREYLELDAKSDSRQENWAQMAAMRLMAYGITALLMAMGILNYINTAVTDLLSRRRELALLECAGMTRKQLRRMLIKEGLRYSLSAMGLSAAGGAVLLPLLLKVIRLRYYTFHFVCPAAQFAGMSLLLILCGIWVPLLVYRKESKETIAERLRHGR